MRLHGMRRSSAVSCLGTLSQTGIGACHEDLFEGTYCISSINELVALFVPVIMTVIVWVLKLYSPGGGYRRLIVIRCMSIFRVDPEEEGSPFLQIVGTHRRDYTVSTQNATVIKLGCCTGCD
jgi:hypothetical protein